MFKGKVLALTALVALGSASAAQAADLVLGVPNWPAANATSNILKVVIEDNFGLEVELQNGTNPIIFEAMDTGSMHLHPEVWLPNQINLHNKYVNENGSVVMNENPVQAVQGMTESRSLDRTRPELAAFLRSRRERISPEEVGLPLGKRRRTPGLRREEVAALAGVGLTWYTWLEQGRSIGVSTAFLDRLSKALKLDATERRHLFLLALDRPPSEPGKTWCIVPPLIHRLMGDLATSPSYVMDFVRAYPVSRQP